MAYVEAGSAPSSGLDKEAEAKIKKEMDSGRQRMRDGAPLANECVRFFQNDQYVYRDKSNALQRQDVEGGRAPGEDGFRMRQTRNIIIDIVETEASAATQRIPDYEINPSTTDPEDIDAAKLSTKAASYGHDKFNIEDVALRVVKHAVVADEGFAWPYFDNAVGDPIDGADVSTGEICVRVYGRNEVFWKSGLRFEDSPWVCVEQGQDPERVMAMPGYIKGDGPLKPDAIGSDVEDKDNSRKELVLVADYLERPTPKNPLGRWLTFAGGRQISPPRNYPRQAPDKAGKLKIVDEPCIHKLCYIVDPFSDRDMGLVRFLLDPQRTVNDCVNKQLEWKNLALVPQMVGPPQAVRTPLTNKPGLYVEAIPYGGVLPKWREVPPIPPELDQIMLRAIEHMGRIGSQNDIPNQVESGKGIEAFYNDQADRRYAFIKQLAKWYSDVCRHYLCLMQQHYTEERLLKIRGRFGPESLASFQGADLRGQVDVTVMPGSIEPRTRQWIEQRVMRYAELGWIPPEAAMAAINNGTGLALAESYELQIARAHQIIQTIRAFGQEGDTLPRPRPFENLDVIEHELTTWMLTSDFDTAPEWVQEAGEQYYEALKILQEQKAMQEAAAQTAQAEALGMQNAAKTPEPKALPSSPKLPPA